MGIFKTLICVAVCWLVLASKSWALETVTLQLKWKHQFQFAGYYAAREKGFYRDAGLDVIIREAQPGQDPIKQVIQGHADYGVGTSELILEHSHGAPVVVLAVIFQHSPLGLVISKTNELTNLQDLIGQSIMIEPNSAELFAYLEKEGLYSDQFNLIEHSFDVKDLLQSKVAAMSVYVTDEPFSLKQANHEFVLFEPRMGGIDFYGDNLFTTQDELKQNPERTKAFIQASLKGWKYAMDNPNEIIDLIYSRYSKRHTKPHLEFEANQMARLMQPSLVEPGYMHAGRWEHIARTYKEQGKLSPTYSIEGFLYQPSEDSTLQRLAPWLIGILALSLLVIFASIPFLRLNRKLSASQNWLRTIIDNAPNALIIVNEQGVVKDWNQHAEKIFGWSAEEAMGKNAYDLLIPASNVTVVKQALEKVFSKGENHTGKEWNITKTGKRILCRWNNAFIEHHSDNGRHMVSMAVDITKQKQMEDKLKLRAYTDPLTGVNNRNIFYMKFNHAINQAKRRNSLLAVLFIDLDNFKGINDSYGHEAGDMVLKTTAERIKDHCRETDIISRIGGDEFVILLDDCENRTIVRQVAEKLLRSIIKPIEINETKIIAVSASIGISLYPEHGIQPEPLLRVADLAMYKVKQGSKNNIYIAEAE